MRMTENSDPEFMAMLKGSSHGRRAIQEIEKLRDTCATQDKRWYDKLSKANQEIERLKESLEEWRRASYRQAVSQADKEK